MEVERFPKFNFQQTKPKRSLVIRCLSSGSQLGVNYSTVGNSAFKGLKGPNERKYNGTAVLHQVAQYLINQVYFIQCAHAPLCPGKTWRNKVLAAEQVGLCTPPNPHLFCSEGQLKRVGIENFAKILAIAWYSDMDKPAPWEVKAFSNILRAFPGSWVSPC